jgi:membrane-associated phospholipid phosphatase
LESSSLANWFSTLLSAPIVSTVFCILAPYYVGYSFDLGYLALVLMGIFFYAFLPFSSTFMRIVKRNNDIYISDLKERPKHFIAGILGYIVSAILFSWIDLTYYVIFSLTSLIIACITLIITFRWKISIHVIGFCTPLTLLSIISHGIFYPLLIFTPILMWARVKVKAHNWLQVLAGAFLGIFGTIFFEYSLENLFNLV